MKKKTRNEIAQKRFLKQKYSKAFDIVKKYIDNLDLMQLLEIGCPKNEYESEIIDIVKLAIKTKEVSELTEAILSVFNKAFNENFDFDGDRIIEASKNIINELRLLNSIEKETYFIPKDLLPGSCYFEFKPGKYEFCKEKKYRTQLDNSLYMYGDDDGNFDYSAILPFTYLITSSHPNHNNSKFFDYCGITYIDENNGEEIVKKLRNFSLLLDEGKQVFEALEIMMVYCPDANYSFHEKNSIKKINLIVLKNTTDYLADWIERTLKEYKWISILGI